MAQTRLTIAAPCVDAVRRNVSSLRQVKAESLRHAFVAHVAGERTTAAVRQRAQELAEVEEVLEQLGRDGDAPEAVEVEASETLLRDAAYGAAIDAVETAAELVQSCWRGERGPLELARAITLASALAALIEEVDRR